MRTEKNIILGPRKMVVGQSTKTTTLKQAYEILSMNL